MENWEVKREVRLYNDIYPGDLDVEDYSWRYVTKNDEQVHPRPACYQKTVTCRGDDLFLFDLLKNLLNDDNATNVDVTFKTDVLTDEYLPSELVLMNNKHMPRYAWPQAKKHQMRLLNPGRVRNVVGIAEDMYYDGRIVLITDEWKRDRKYFHPSFNHIQFHSIAIDMVPAPMFRKCWTVQPRKITHVSYIDNITQTEYTFCHSPRY